MYQRFKKLMSLRMYSEASQLVRQAQQIYPDKYQRYVMEIMYSTENYSAFIVLSTATIQKAMDLMKYDNQVDREFYAWLERYRKEWAIFQNNFILCNKIPPLTALRVLGCTSPTPGDLIQYTNPHYAENIENMYFDLCYDGFAFNIYYVDWDHRYGRSIKTHEHKSFVVRTNLALHKRIPELEAAAAQSWNRTGTCPFCGRSFSLFSKAG